MSEYLILCRGQISILRLTHSSKKIYINEIIYTLQYPLLIFGWLFLLTAMVFGYYGLICASDFGGSVPGKTVQTVPFFTV